MVAAKTKHLGCDDHENEQPNAARKRQCNRGAVSLGCNATRLAADPAAEFLHQFNLAQGLSSPDHAVSELVWRCFAEFNVLMRTHAGMLRDLPLCGYLSLTRCAKAAAFGKLVDAERLAPGQPWPLHVHITCSILQRFFWQFPDASLCRYTVTRPDWLRQWCAQWGLGADATVALFAVNAYDNSYEPLHVHGGELQASVENLNRTLFVPVIGT